MEEQTYTQPVITRTPTQLPQPGPERKSNKGLVSLILLLVILLIVGLVATYLWQHNKVTTLQSQLTATRGQKNATTSQTSNAPSSQEYLYLNSFGLKIPLTKDIQDLYYVQFKDVDGNNVLVFSTQSLANAEPGCFAVPTTYSYSYESSSLNNNPPQTSIDGTPFGLISVTSQPAPASQVGKSDEDIGTEVAHSNGYYFYYKQAQGTCLATDNKGNVTSQTDSNLLSNQLNSFLAQIKKIEPVN